MAQIQAQRPLTHTNSLVFLFPKADSQLEIRWSPNDAGTHGFPHLCSGDEDQGGLLSNLTWVGCLFTVFWALMT